MKATLKRFLGSKPKTLSSNNDSISRLVFPIFIEMLLTMLVGNLDQYMVKTFDENAVGAIGNANQIMNLLLIMFMVISMSTTILSAQYIGSDNRDKLPTIYTLSIFVNLIFSAIISFVVLTFVDPIFAFMKIPADIYDYAVQYMKWIAGFIVLQGLNSTFSAIFRANRLMKETMYISIFVNVTNLVFNYLLINGIGPFPVLGVAGAAIATNISRLVGVIIYITIYVKRFKEKMSLSHLRPFPKTELKKLLGIGLPSGGESLSYSGAMTYIMKIVNGFGTFVINAKVIASTYAWFSFMYALAVGQASQVVIGNYMGAGEVDKVHKRVMKSLRNSVIVSILISTSIYLFSDFLFGIFSSDPNVLALGKKIMFVDIFLEIGKSSNITLVRSLQATGDTKFPTMVGIISMWTIAVGLAIVLGVFFDMGIIGLWIAMALDECIRSVIFYIRWKKGKWRYIRLAND